MSRNLIDQTAERGDSEDPRPTREHFIPIRRADLVERLGKRLSNSQRERFLELSRILAATFHYEFHLRLDRLKSSYALLDPDRDTAVVDGAIDSGSSPDVSASAERFVAETVELLERANFVRIAQSDIEAALGSSSDWGINLQIDLELFERLEVYARGDVLQTRTRRRLRNRYRMEHVDVPMYQRLVVVFQLRNENRLERWADPNRVYLKLFKDIPKMDLDMLLPGTRVKMTRFDQGKIILPTVSGFGMALFKIVNGVALLATATLAGLLSFLGLLGGTIGYGIKSILGYLRTKDKYQLNLTRSLYFQNLDNNAGVLHRLLDEAEEQEVREAILGWFLLWQQAPAEGWTDSELDEAVEAYLAKQFSIQVDFEIDDALAKLHRLGLCRCDQQGRWTAASLDEALEQLDRSWDNLFQHHQPDPARRAA